MLEINTIQQFFKHVGAMVPQEKDLVVSYFEAGKDSMPKFKPFRHTIYTISVYTQLDYNAEAVLPILNTDQPILFFKVPYQTISTESIPAARKGYSVTFTENFIAQYPHLMTLIFQMDYLRIDEAIPILLKAEQEQQLRTTFEHLLTEFQDEKQRSMDILASHFHTYLLQIKRIYEQEKPQDALTKPTKEVSDLTIAAQFKSLLDNYLREAEQQTSGRSVAQYAELLAVHPNHLNACVKKVYGKTAQVLIHEQLIRLAKTLLLQSNLTIKEIGYQLQFNEPAHFSNFFKRNVMMSPAQFRENMRRN